VPGDQRVPALVRPAGWQSTALPRKAPVWKAAVNVVLAVATIVLIIAVLLRVIPMIEHRPARHVPVLTIVAQFLLLMLLFPPVVLAHELGHAIAGTLAGWRLQSLFVGPWRFIREGRRARLVLHRSFFYYGGAAVVVPREWGTDERVRRSFRGMVAGGPLASFLTGIACIALLRALSPDSGVPKGGARFYLFVAGVMSFGIGIGTLLPIRQTRAIRNDGLQLLLTRPRRPLDPGIRLGALVLMLTERRPRDWTPEMLAVLAASAPAQREGFEYYHALDVGDVSRARATLQATLDRVSGVDGVPGARARQEAALEAAIFETAWRGDAPAGREWLSIGRDAQAWDPHAFALAQAAIHAAAGDATTAAHMLARGEREALQRIIARVDLLRAPLIERIRAMSAPALS